MSIRLSTLAANLVPASSISTSKIEANAITTALILDDAVTLSKLESSTRSSISSGGGPKISSVTVTDSSYNNLDDTAVGLDGGYIKLSGTGFVTGCQVLINNTPVTSVSFISSTEVRCQVPATAAGTYTLYLVNSDGGVAIRVNGITFSATPTWVTGSTLPEAATNESISILLSATDAASYQLQAGSTLPTGLSLSSNGLLSGNVSVENQTTYNFTIEAIDAELQESARAFSISITVGDEYFNYTTLLLNGDGTNGAQNNTFIDSSTNNFTITRNGNTTQGTFSPFSQDDGKWSGFFGASDAVATSSTGIIPATGDFTIECFVFTGSGETTMLSQGTTGSGGRTAFGITSGKLYLQIGSVSTSTGDVPLNQWAHVAATRAGSSVTFYINGSASGTATLSASVDNAVFRVGGNWAQASGLYSGYISNVRVSNVVRTISVPTTPFVNDANTRILLFQSNRFKDNSSNAYALTVSGTTSIQPFSPFAPSAAYSTAVNGGSAYFDQTGDYLQTPASSMTTLIGTSSLQSGANLTIEGWVYITALHTNSNNPVFLGDMDPSGGAIYWGFGPTNLNKLQLYWYDGSTRTCTGDSTMAINSWNHIAVSISSGAISLYVNGRKETLTGTTSTTNTTGSTGRITLNQFANGGTLYSEKGYFYDVRVVKSPVYTDTFVPPTAPLTAIANTSLLLNFTNAGILDNTGRNNLETVGNAQISTSVKKFGTGSMYFDGSGDYLTLHNLLNTNFGSEPFTIELWAYFNSVSGTRFILSNYQSSTIGYGLGLASGVVSFWATGDGADISSGFTPSTEVWYHLAVSGQSGAIRLFINGTQYGSTFTGTPALNSTLTLRIGDGQGAASPQPFSGYIDDLRITKGVARYTSNFTPPAAAHKLK